MPTSKALAAIPEGLRVPLLSEYQSIVQNYSEHRWSPAELSAGIFCEIVYTILDGHAKDSYPAHPNKPADFVGACRKLEQNTNVPRSFQILIPRILPALYEVRNNRGVGHTGGDVDPNHMDATLVLSGCNWVMAELVRVFHELATRAAQEVIDRLTETRIPLILEGENVRRVLHPELSMKDQVLLLLSTSAESVATSALIEWTGATNRSYFLKLLRQMHRKRLIELAKDQDHALILPPGSNAASDIIRKTLK